MRISEIFRRMLMTKKCLACGEVISYDIKAPFCEDCLEQWQQFTKMKCHRCGHTRTECTCLPSQIREISKHGAVWCVFYDAKSNLPLNNLVFKLKRDYNRDIIEFCATEIVKNLKSLCLRHGIDYKDYLITYTPRRVSGKRKYGFDHSKRMALEISRILGIKTIKTLINVGTAEQKTLSKEKRKENAKQSYELSKNASVSGKKLFIVDDIITSGSTMKACADLLYQSGATDIIPLAFAKDNR